MNNNGKENQALIFANGPYQLMVGLACARKHIHNLQKIEVITYDMQWQDELNKITRDYIDILKLNFIKLPYEFRKSDISNFSTYRVRTFINHILFFLYSKKYGKKNIFIPKLYGSPERAIILASLNKNIFVYDDGFGIYLDPRINQRKLDKSLYQLIDFYSRRFDINIGIFPRKPQLITYDNFHEIKISKIDYSAELSIIIQNISNYYKEAMIANLEPKIDKKKRILIALPRLTLSVKKELGEKIHQLIDAITLSFPTVYFLLKPHPRDVPLDFSFLKEYLGNDQNWGLLPKSTWCQPVEVISLSLLPVLILSGWSTVGINEDLLSQTKVMVFDFLSFDLPNYNNFAKMLMKKTGTYSGETVQNAIEKITGYFQLEPLTNIENTNE